MKSRNVFNEFRTRQCLKWLIPAMVASCLTPIPGTAQPTTYGVPTYEWSPNPFRDQLGKVRTDGIESDISHILIKGGENDLKASDRARAICDSIVTGKVSFEEAAKRYSKCKTAQSGGYLGWVKPGTWVENLDVLAFALKAGEVSTPVHSKFGWHIVKHHGYRYRLADTQVECVIDDAATLGTADSTKSSKDSDGPGLGEILLGALLIGLAIDNLADASTPAQSRADLYPAQKYYQPAAKQVQSGKDEAFYARELERLKKQNFNSSISGFTVSVGDDGAVLATQRELGALSAGGYGLSSGN